MKLPARTASRYASSSDALSCSHSSDCWRLGSSVSTSTWLRRRYTGSTALRKATEPAGASPSPRESAIPGCSIPTRLRNSTTLFSMGVPVMNRARSQCSAHPATAWDRLAFGFFTQCASSTTSSPTSPPPGSGNPRSASNVVTATPPRPFQSANASCRSGPCSTVTRRVLRASISRVQLTRTLAGQTTMKWLCPSAARCASTAIAWMVFPRPISSPRITLRCARTKRAPNAW